MIRQSYKDIVTPELLKGAIENNEYHGFLEDYHVLHCLLKIYQPKTFLEIGTNRGRGTSIIKNALGKDSTVYSLDLPTELAHISLQHPINEGHGDKVGELCKLPYIQLRGDSMTFDFSQYPCDGFFIDGEHDYFHPYRETCEVLKNWPKIVIWHDSDIDCVYQAINDAVSKNNNGGFNLWYRKAEAITPMYLYKIYRVEDTRIAYALRIDIANA